MADFLSSSLRRDCFLLVAAIIDGHPKNQLLLASLSITPVGGTSSLTALFRPLPFPPAAAAVGSGAAAVGSGADKFSAARLTHALLPAGAPPAANGPACFRCVRLTEKLGKHANTMLCIEFYC